MPIVVRYDNPAAAIGASFAAGEGIGAYEAKVKSAEFQLQRNSQSLEAQRIAVAAQGQALSFAAQLASIRSHEAQQQRAIAAQKSESRAQREFQAQQAALRETAATQHMREQFSLQGEYQMNLLRERTRLEQQDREAQTSSLVRRVEESRRQGLLNDQQYQLAKRQALLGGDPGKNPVLTRLDSAVRRLDDFGTYEVRQPDGSIELKVGAKRSLLSGPEEFQKRAVTMRFEDGTSVNGYVDHSGAFKPIARNAARGGGDDEESFKTYLDALKDSADPEKDFGRLVAMKRRFDLHKMNIPEPGAEIEYKVMGKDGQPASHKLPVVNPIYPRPAETQPLYEQRLQKSLKAGQAFWNSVLGRWDVYKPIFDPQYGLGKGKAAPTRASTMPAVAAAGGDSGAGWGMMGSY